MTQTVSFHVPTHTSNGKWRKEEKERGQKGQKEPSQVADGPAWPKVWPRPLQISNGPFWANNGTRSVGHYRSVRIMRRDGRPIMAQRGPITGPTVGTSSCVYV